MTDDESRTSASLGRPGPLRAAAHLGGRAASSALRPLNGAVDAAVGIGVSLERKAVDRVLESGEIERVMLEVIESPGIQAALERVLSSPGASRLVDSFFDSGMFDRVIERLLASDALWNMIDEIAGSPAVTAAISQQGLGFADQVGEQVRDRSRQADDWLERAARRIVHRRREAFPETPDAAPS
jgi:hypothetical protein